MQQNTKSPTIKPAGLDEVPIIEDLARRTWFHAYGNILSLEQIRYMLNELYSKTTLGQLIESNAQQFVILYHKNLPGGFAAYGATADLNLKLHKIYVLPALQGFGYGKVLIDYVKKQALKTQCSCLELNVNRYNKAISFYEKM